MLRRRANPTLTFALCVSMTVHALLLTAVARWYVRHPPSQRVAWVPHDTRAPIIVTSALPTPPPPPPPPKPEPQKSKPPPPPPEPQPKFAHTPPPPLRDDSGEATGTGTANRSTPGRTPMQSLQGLEQAKLDRSVRPTPDDSASALDNTPAPAQRETVGQVPEPSVVGVPVPDPVNPTPPPKPPMIAIVDPNQPAPLPVPPARPTPETAWPAKRPVGQGGRSSDTDSVPFARANSVTFKDGQMVGRKGRRVRTTHIDFGLAAEGDAATLEDPRVVLGVTVDAAGNVQNVTVLRSSGSDNIDLPAQNAVYNWWFEPLKNPAGRPLPDVWVVTIE